MKDAVGKMNKEGGKIDGTAIMTVTTMDAVKSAEQLAAEAKQTPSGAHPIVPPQSPQSPQ